MQRTLKVGIKAEFWFGRVVESKGPTNLDRIRRAREADVARRISPSLLLVQKLTCSCNPFALFLCPIGRCRKMNATGRQCMPGSLFGEHRESLTVYCSRVSSCVTIAGSIKLLRRVEVKCYPIVEECVLWSKIETRVVDGRTRHCCWSTYYEYRLLAKADGERLLASHQRERERDLSQNIWETDGFWALNILERFSWGKCSFVIPRPSPTRLTCSFLLAFRLRQFSEKSSICSTLARYCINTRNEFIFHPGNERGADVSSVAVSTGDDVKK